jgi:hypothetical protein
VAEGKPIPVNRISIDNVGLTPEKIAGISVWTEEALKAAPAVERLIFDDLVKACVDGLDFAMFDPTNDGSGVPPAALTNGGTSIASTSDIDDDLAEVFAAFTGDLSTAYFVTTPQLGAGLAGEFTGRDIGARGGELCGIPVLTSAAAPDGQLTLIDPSQVMAAWEEFFDLQTSRAGTVEMLDDSLTQDQPTGAAMVSLFQNFLVSFRAIGSFSWAMAGPSKTVSITGLFPSAT